MYKISRGMVDTAAQLRVSKRGRFLNLTRPLFPHVAQFVGLNKWNEITSTNRILVNRASIRYSDICLNYGLNLTFLVAGLRYRLSLNVSRIRQCR